MFTELLIGHNSSIPAQQQKGDFIPFPVYCSMTEGSERRRDLEAEAVYQFPFPFTLDKNSSFFADVQHTLRVLKLPDTLINFSGTDSGLQSRWPGYPARRKASTCSPDESESMEQHIGRHSPPIGLASLMHGASQAPGAS